jgi:hypothetical protein
MASVTITQLPTATLPLVGTEVLPVVRSGTTYQTTVAAVATSPQTTATVNGISYYNSSKIPTSSSLLTFDGTTVVAPSYTFNATTTGSSTKGALNYGTLGFSDTGIVQSAQTSVNSYFQNVMQNTSAGGSASAEFIVYNDQGTASTNYAAFGINSSGYSGTGSINAAGYGFFATASTDLVLGTIGANAIHFTTNSSATDAMAISSAGAVSLPGGTANGVVYMNGSKVVTSGTSLTFDGTNVGVGTNLQMRAGATMPWAPAPAAISTTATLTNANIQGQIISTTGTSYTVTMPLGTTLETLATWLAADVGYDFFVINTASGTITMAVNTGVTSLGGLTIATGTSAHFRIRRTAANTFVLYRLV